MGAHGTPEEPILSFEERGGLRVRVLPGRPGTASGPQIALESLLWTTSYPALGVRSMRVRRGSGAPPSCCSSCPEGGP